MIEIAKILKPQGIKGEVKAQPSTNILAVFKSVQNVRIGFKEYQIERLSLRQGFLYIKFKGIDTRNQAEELRNCSIEIDKDLLVEIKGNEFLIDDLIGMVLYSTKGELVGQIVDVVNYGSCDIFIIEHNGRQYQAPYVEDVFIKEGDKLVVDSEKFKEVVI